MENKPIKLYIYHDAASIDYKKEGSAVLKLQLGVRKKLIEYEYKFFSHTYIYIYIYISKSMKSESLPFLCFCATRFTAVAALQA